VASQYSSRSFDSRYFGAVAESSLQSVIRPIWTIENTR
jgi:type IV secretory pathway protease TraF